MKTSITLLLILTALTLLAPLHAVALDTKEIEEAIMCICKDKCGKVLANCTCGTADLHRKKIDAMIGQGKSREEIIAHYVNRFGEEVLSAPTKEGFNLTAWLVPFIAIFAGAWGISRLAKRWVSTSGTETPARPGPRKKQARGKERDPYTRLMENELKEYE